MSDPTPAKPLIGITLGDYNGIGPEVILKALQGNQFNKLMTPVVYGSMRVLNRYRHLLNLKEWQLHGAPDIDAVNPKLVSVITCWPDGQTEVEPGQVTPEAGVAALACLQKATEDLKAGRLDALVTAPINKYTMQSEEFKFPGHTEYFTQEFGARDSLMFLVSEVLRVGVVTGHIPIGRVRSQVNQDAITRKLHLMLDSLRRDFGIQKPKIAVLGLNPHAGEDGLIGQEEKDVIVPVLEQFRKKGHLLFGPYPADGFFAARQYRQFDAVLAMYHDQGLTPFKMLAFEDGVNFTAGLPIVRTSPDHGTAYDIAGKSLADESSFRQAIFTALDIVKNRALAREIAEERAEVV
jgi:4-hydroxythreonine-4-phosphate dehydrogenase